MMIGTKNKISDVAQNNRLSHNRREDVVESPTRALSRRQERADEANSHIAGNQSRRRFNFFDNQTGRNER
jgi:hypothetical protein